MTLSVIIPVYNVEDTLRRCVGSVIRQGIGDMEVILVDDGSTDSSGRIAEDCAKEYNCVSCLHKENGGLSDARNYGMERAKGELMTFVDSDDQLADGSYKPLIEFLSDNTNVDIIEFPVAQRAGLPDEKLFMPGQRIFGNALDWLAWKGTEHCWVWNKIFRRKAISGIRFAKGEKFEDVLFMAEVIRRNPVIAATDKGRYLYYYNSKGIAATDRNDGGLAALLKAQLRLISRLGINTRERRWHRLYMDMLTSQLYAYRQTQRLLLQPQRIRLFGYASWKDTIKALLVNIFGLRNSCRLFMKMKRQ